MKKFIKQVESLKNDNSATIALFALKYVKSQIVAIKVDFADGFRDFFKSSLDYLIRTDYTQKDIKKYPQGDLKNCIEAIPMNSALIITPGRCKALLNALANPETNLKDIEDCKAYIIHANLNGKNAYFIKVARPFKTLTNSSYWIWAKGNNSYKPITKSLLNLVYHFDCIILEDYCYLMSLKAENFLQLPKEYAKKREECIKKIKDTNLITGEDEEEIRKYLNRRYNRSMLSYNQDIVSELGSVNDNNQATLVRKYGVTFEKTDSGKIKLNLSDIEELESFMEVITNKRGRDLLKGEMVCSSSPFVPV